MMRNLIIILTLFIVITQAKTLRKSVDALSASETDVEAPDSFETLSPQVGAMIGVEWGTYFSIRIHTHISSIKAT